MTTDRSYRTLVEGLVPTRDGIFLRDDLRQSQHFLTAGLHVVHPPPVILSGGDDFVLRP